LITHGAHHGTAIVMSGKRPGGGHGASHLCPKSPTDCVVGH
jgi:hypothetical protein